MHCTHSKQQTLPLLLLSAGLSFLLLPSFHHGHGVWRAGLMDCGLDCLAFAHPFPDHDFFILIVIVPLSHFLKSHQIGSVLEILR